MVKITPETKLVIGIIYIPLAVMAFGTFALGIAAQFLGLSDHMGIYQGLLGVAGVAMTLYAFVLFIRRC